MAFNNPLPLTSSIKSLVFAYSDNSDLKILPKRSAFSARFSSMATSKAAMATLQAKGFPPNVEPCSPGLMVIMISLSAKTADTGNTPPDNAFPKINISGLNPSC